MSGQTLAQVLAGALHGYLAPHPELCAPGEEHPTGGCMACVNIAQALAPVVDRMVAEAEQRGREDADEFQRGYDAGCDDPESVWTSTIAAAKAEERERIEEVAYQRGRTDVAEAWADGYEQRWRDNQTGSFTRNPHEVES